MSNGPAPAAGHSGGGGGSTTCHSPDGFVEPCSSSYGNAGANGCYYQLDTSFSPPAADTVDQHAAGTGAWYVQTCTYIQGRTALPTTIKAPVWIASGARPVAVAATVPLAVLAQRAESQLPLSAPDIHANPAPAREVVRLPVWAWISGTAYAPRSATASVPGESVTATALPVSVTWTWGDGSTMVCHSAGTTWMPSDSPTAPSPTCGHTYLTSSAGQPNAAYPVTATLTWQVSWAGAGTGGVLPDLSRSSIAAFRVAQIETLNVP
jgi:hypothetical protein